MSSQEFKVKGGVIGSHDPKVKTAKQQNDEKVKSDRAALKVRGVAGMSAKEKQDVIDSIIAEWLAKQ